MLFLCLSHGNIIKSMLCHVVYFLCFLLFNTKLHAIHFFLILFLTFLFPFLTCFLLFIIHTCSAVLHFRKQDDDMMMMMALRYVWVSLRRRKYFALNMHIHKSHWEWGIKYTIFPSWCLLLLFPFYRFTFHNFSSLKQ